MQDWAEFTLAMGLFLGAHLVPGRPALRAALIARLGRRPYLLAYSALSLLLFAWAIAAAGRAPFVPVWDQQIWMRWAANLVMPAVLALGCFGIAAPNPFAFEGRARGFDPARPGIAGVTRQPLLWAMLLWALVHGLVNGDLAHLLLFGPLLAFAALGLVVAEAKARRRLGADWPRLAAHTAALPLAALVLGRWRPRGAPSWRRLVLWLILWGANWHLHAPVIGVWPGV